jgi:hypothetical protein
MELNAYALEAMTQQRLEELRVYAEQHELVRALARPRRPLRVALGLTLIRVGTWTLGRDANTLAPRLS